MGRKSMTEPLLEPIQASDVARERVKVVLLTLCGDWSVNDALDSLSLSRTRFQDLRRKMLEEAVHALEPQTMGRPRKKRSPKDARVAALEDQVTDLRSELARVRARLELAEGPAALSVRQRVLHKMERPQR